MSRIAGALVLLLAVPGCARYVSPPDIEPEAPFVEGRRVWFDDRTTLRKQYFVLIEPDGAVLKHGDEEEWYRSGVKKAEREFARGAPAGTWRSWYESGVLSSEVHIGDGGSPALHRWWHADGTLQAEGLGVAGVREGAWSHWHANGALASRGVYRAGLREGSWTFWYADGGKEAEGLYEQGWRVGEWKLWSEGGRLTVKRDGSLEQALETKGLGLRRPVLRAR